MSTEIATQLVELKPNPLPYGRLPLRAGAWDYLVARKAYEERELRPPELDRKI
jgi:hypothetical protein